MSGNVTNTVGGRLPPEYTLVELQCLNDPNGDPYMMHQCNNGACICQLCCYVRCCQFCCPKCSRWPGHNNDDKQMCPCGMDLDMYYKDIIDDRYGLVVDGMREEGKSWSTELKAKVQRIWLTGLGRKRIRIRPWILGLAKSAECNFRFGAGGAAISCVESDKLPAFENISFS